MKQVSFCPPMKTVHYFMKYNIHPSTAHGFEIVTTLTKIMSVVCQTHARMQINYFMYGRLGFNFGGVVLRNK